MVKPTPRQVLSTGSLIDSFDPRLRAGLAELPPRQELVVRISGAVVALAMNEHRPTKAMDKAQ